MNLCGSHFTIRPVIIPDELENILTVYRQCEDFLALGPVATASLEMVKTDLDISREDGGTFCGIFENSTGSMIGIIDFVPSGWESDPGCAFLELLMIAAPHRGLGLGAEVVRLVEEEIRRDPQVKVIQSGVQVNNPGGIRFWQNQGYEITSGPRAIPDGTVAYSLRKVF